MPTPKKLPRSTGLRKTSTVRKVGGSAMLTIPSAIMEAWGAPKTGCAVEVTVADDSLLITKAPRRRPTLDERLAQCDPALPDTAGDEAWLDGPARGREIL